MRRCQFLAVIFSMTFFVSLALSASSQQAGSGSNPSSGASTRPSQSPQGDKAAPDTPEADDSLNLTDDQKTRIKTIREDTQDQLKAMQKDKTLSDDQRQKKAKQIKMETRKQGGSGLTPKQRKIWADEARERREAKSPAIPQ